jgi:hypothetical protein
VQEIVTDLLKKGLLLDKLSDNQSKLYSGTVGILGSRETLKTTHAAKEIRAN